MLEEEFMPIIRMLCNIIKMQITYFVNKMQNVALAKRSNIIQY